MTIVGAVTLTTGTLNTNGQTESWGSFSSNNGNTRTITLGSSSITLTSGSWQSGNSTNQTYSAGSATITLQGANATFEAARSPTGTVIMTGSGQAQLNGNMIITTLTRTGTASKGDSLGILAGSNIICTTLNINSNSSVNRLLIQSKTVGSNVTFTAGTVNITNIVDFMDVTGAGAATWTVAGTGATALGDCGGNSGITFTTSVQQTCTMSTNKNWSDVTIWTSRVPLPQDDVVMTGVTGGTLTADMPRLGRSIDWTGATGSPTWGFSSTANTIYGSVTLISGMTISGTQNLILAGRSSYNLTSAGKQYTQAVFINAPGGTYTLQDAFSAVGQFLGIGSNMIGSFNANNFNVTCNGTDLSGSNTRSVTMGTGTWTLIRTTTGNSWNASSVTNLTFSGNQATIIISNTTTNTRTFAGGGLSYGTLTYTVAGSTGTLVITGSNTFNTINFSDASNARTLQFTAGTTTTINNANGFNVFGTSGKNIIINSSSAGSKATLSSANNQAVSFCTITDVEVTGGGTWTATNSVNGSANNGTLTGNPLPLWRCRPLANRSTLA